MELSYQRLTAAQMVRTINACLDDLDNDTLIPWRYTVEASQTETKRLEVIIRKYNKVMSSSDCCFQIYRGTPKNAVLYLTGILQVAEHNLTSK